MNSKGEFMPAHAYKEVTTTTTEYIEHKPLISTPVDHVAWLHGETTFSQLNSQNTFDFGVVHCLLLFVLRKPRNTYYYTSV